MRSQKECEVKRGKPNSLNQNIMVIILLPY